MRAVVQKVSNAAVMVDEQTVGQIGPGFLILLGVGTEDSKEDAQYLADKVSNLRIFPDEQGKMNLSIRDIGGSVLVVSQFTLYGDCRKGRRPSFTQAARPEQAEDLYRYFLSLLQQQGIPVETGVFQAHMQVSLVNDGPVTMLLDSQGNF